MHGKMLHRVSKNLRHTGRQFVLVAFYNYAITMTKRTYQTANLKSMNVKIPNGHVVIYRQISPDETVGKN